MTGMFVVGEALPGSAPPEAGVAVPSFKVKLHANALHQ